VASRDDIKDYVATRVAFLLTTYSDAGVYEGQAQRARPARVDARVAYHTSTPVRRKGRLTRHYLTCVVSVHGRDRTADDTLSDTLEGAVRAVHDGLDAQVGGANGSLAGVSVERLRVWAPGKPSKLSATLREQTIRIELDEWEA
jgi:hypothetical protein